MSLRVGGYLHPLQAAHLAKVSAASLYHILVVSKRPPYPGKLARADPVLHHVLGAAETEWKEKSERDAVRRGAKFAG